MFGAGGASCAQRQVFDGNARPFPSGVPHLISAEASLYFLDRQTALNFLIPIPANISPLVYGHHQDKLYMHSNSVS